LLARGRTGCGSVVDARAGRAESDVVTMTERPFSDDAFAVDVGAVEASEITENELGPPALDDAVLL
jgi:hypothetical protein